MWLTRALGIEPSWAPLLSSSGTGQVDGSTAALLLGPAARQYIYIP